MEQIHIPTKPPSNCKLKTCKYNRIPPGENSQECIGCEGNKSIRYMPKR